MIYLVCVKQMAEQLFENGFPLLPEPLMAMSLLQGGQNPTIFSKLTYKFISTSTAVTPEDYEVRPKFHIEETVKEVCITSATSRYFLGTPLS